jgi:hypothetical protein
MTQCGRLGVRARRTVELPRLMAARALRRGALLDVGAANRAVEIGRCLAGFGLRLGERHDAGMMWRARAGGSVAAASPVSASAWQ